MSGILTETDIRLIGLSAPVLLKLLRAREARLLGGIYGQFRAGKLDQTTALAEWASVRDQIHEIESVLRQHDKQEGKKHDTSSDSDSDRPTF